MQNVFSDLSPNLGLPPVTSSAFGSQKKVALVYASALDQTVLACPVPPTEYRTLPSLLEWSTDEHKDILQKVPHTTQEVNMGS